MSAEQIAMAALTVIVSTIGSAVASTVAHRIHIQWIKDTLDRHEKAITRAHARIDENRGGRP